VVAFAGCYANAGLLYDHAIWPQGHTQAEAGKRLREIDFNALWDKAASACAAKRSYLECRHLRADRLHKDSVDAAAFSPDGERIATASLDHTARLWDATGAPLSEPMRHGDAVYSVAFSPDGNRIVTASADHTARLWDTARQGVRRSRKCRSQRVSLDRTEDRLQL
jgi:WD40 repeat protein